MMRTTSAAAVGLGVVLGTAHAFAPAPPYLKAAASITRSSILWSKNEEWTSDFDDFRIDDDDDAEDPFSMTSILQTTQEEDSSACRTRQFRLGEDLSLRDFAGSMGFDAVTDWEYYYESEDGDGERKVVTPSPLDPETPKRTRKSSGSVIRIFRGQLEGLLGPSLRSQGLDSRILVKEFSGQLALELAQAELTSVSKLQSNLLENIDTDDWASTALARTSLQRKDNANVATLMRALQKAPFCGILGEVNLAELEGELDSNEFYRALGVNLPKPGSIWIVYEYTGLNTLQPYCQPALQRISSIPPRRGPFGNIIAPPKLPSFQERANYVVKGIIQQALEALAMLHEAGIAHRSIGRSSIYISSVSQNKMEASSPYTTNLSSLRIKLADFGFSGRFQDSTQDEDFVSRAKSFGLKLSERSTPLSTIQGYAMAEDLHALGFVVLALLLTSLAETEDANQSMPATDEDTLQRLLTDIFEQDMKQFRDYVEAEEMWAPLVRLLDEQEGWDFLESLLFAREQAAEKGEIQTARGLLLSSKFLQ